MSTPLDPFAGLSVAGLLETRARLSAHCTFLTWAPFEGEVRRWTYGEFAGEVACVAGGLAARGISRGDRVVSMMDNCPEALLTYFGCAWLGAVCVPVNSASTPDELGYFMARTKAVALVKKGDCPRSGAVPRAQVASSDVASILFTSGTTSRPKGVVWTNANVLWGARMGALQTGLREDDVYLVFLPLFHVVALTWSILPTIWVGGEAVLQPRFSASRFWDAAVTHRCTWASMVPFCTAVLAKQPVPARHFFRCWGHALYVPELEKLFGVRLLGWWGMTEVLTQGIVGDLSLPQVPRTIGRPSPGFDIMVLDEAGQPAKPGVPGELRIRGERGVTIFREYLDDPEATAAAFDEHGYFRTGDRVLVREEGAIQFVDRTKDVIKVGGENVAAPEVERVIATVAGVNEVAVVARRDDLLGEVPVAFVLAEPSRRTPELIEQVIAACREQLAKFKVPRDVVLVDEFPRVTLGKIAKAELRKRL